MTSPLIEFHNVSKIYRRPVNKEGFKNKIITLFHPTYTNQYALNDINFTLEAGQSLAILGPNGAGKSTLIKILSGIQQADEGSVKVLGLDPYTKKNSLLQKLGIVFGHKNALWWDLPLRYSMDMIQPLYGLNKETFIRDLNEISKILNISHIMDKPVRLLSLGERVKSELAFNLSFRPKLLFLDEPTIGLDITSKHEMRELLKSLKKETGIGYVITSHDMGDIDGYVDDVILLHNGKKQFHGDIDCLKKMIPSLIRVTIFCENLINPLSAEVRINEIAEKASVFLHDMQLNEEDLSFNVSLSHEAYPRFIQLLTTELNCYFSVSTPSLEEMLRVKFKEFN